MIIVFRHYIGHGFFSDMQFSIDMMMKIRVVLKILEKDNFQCKKDKKYLTFFTYTNFLAIFSTEH